MKGDKCTVTTMAEYHERVKKYLPGGVHQNFNYPWRETPVYCVKGKGSHIWDMDGKEYLDLFAYHGAMIVGHGNKEYNERLQEVMQKNLCVSHADLEAQTMEKISSIYPSAEMIRFGVSESALIQDSIRLAKVYKGREKFVRFENHYHGSQDNVLGGTVKKNKAVSTKGYVEDFRRTRAMAKHMFEECFLLEWNQIEVFEELLEQHGSEIACVIMEPICVSYGSIEPEVTYLKRIKSLCHRYGIILIFDEVTTGVRLGRGGAQVKYNVTPDLTILGKAIGGGGVPVGLLAGKKSIMNLYSQQRVSQGGSYNGYPLGMAAIDTTMDILFGNKQKNFLNMKKQAKKIKEITLNVAQSMDFPLVVQGPELCSSIHCCEKKLTQTKEYTPEIMMKDVILNDCLQRNGVLTKTPLTLFPNISLSDADLTWYEEKLKLAVIEAKELLEG